MCFCSKLPKIWAWTAWCFNIKKRSDWTHICQVGLQQDGKVLWYKSILTENKMNKAFENIIHNCMFLFLSLTCRKQVCLLRQNMLWQHSFSFTSKHPLTPTVHLTPLVTFYWQPFPKETWVLAAHAFAWWQGMFGALSLIKLLTVHCRLSPLH